jgi:hypothetical protein
VRRHVALRAVGSVALLVGCSSDGGESPGLGPEGFDLVRLIVTRPVGDGLLVGGLRTDPAGLTIAVRSGDSDWMYVDDATAAGWMPDGSVLAAIQGRGCETSLVDPDCVSRLVVVDAAGVTLDEVRLDDDLRVEGRIAIAADGATATVAASPINGHVEVTDLYEIDLASGDLTQRTNTPDVVDSSPVLVDRGVLFTSGTFVAARSGPPDVGVYLLEPGRQVRVTPPDIDVADFDVLPSSGDIVVAGFADDDRSEGTLWSIACCEAGVDPVRRARGTYTLIAGVDRERVIGLNNAGVLQQIDI